VPYVYAKEKGYYAAEGLDVTINYGKGSLFTVQDVANNGVDIGQASTGVLALSISKGAALVAVGAYTARSDIGFLVPVNSSIHSIHDLAGKKVITEPGGPEDVLLPAVLKLAGLSPDSVQKIVVSAEIADSTYSSGTGDAISESLPFGAPLINPKRPSRALPWSDVGFNLPGYSIFTTKTEEASHPDLVAKFLRATYRGVIDAMKNSKEAVDLFATANPTLQRTEISQQWFQWTQFFCSKVMITNADVVGYNDSTDWQGGLDLLKQYQGLTGSTSPADYTTNDMFKAPNTASTVSCASISLPSAAG
jgi:NitT/TauT family transport system substrate-binding protein